MNQNSPAARRLWWLLVCMGISLTQFGWVCAAPPDDEEDEFWSEYESGLIAEYQGASGESIRRLDEQVSMVWHDGSPDPRIPSGEFRVKWSGRLKVWAPGEYRFRFYTAGRVRLRVADRLLLAADSKDLTWMDATPVKLEFGHQPLEIEYENTGSEARIAFFWSGPKFQLEPVAAHWLYHDAEQSIEDAFGTGQQLVRALRCASCHDFSAARPPAPGPALDRLAGNISPAWIREWLISEAHTIENDSETIRRMPQFGMSPREAGAIAAYLTGGLQREWLPAESDQAQIESGETLFHSLGCLACHRVGHLGRATLFGGGDLTAIAEKRPPDFFAKWLATPAEFNRDHRMPIFELTPKQRAALAAFLSSARRSQDAVAEAISPSPAMLANGRQLVLDYQCGQCHQLPAAATSAAASSTRLSATSDWEQSCAGTANKAARRPGYGLSEPRQAAVRTFISSLHATAGQTAAESVDAGSILQEQNCLSCHARGSALGMADLLPEVGRVNFALERRLGDMKPPSLDSVGDKLVDQALRATLAGELRRRPWLHVQMPKFRLTDRELSAVTQYFIDVDRIPAAGGPVTRFDETKLRLAGSRLVTTDGFGCTSCHQIGDVKPTHVQRGVHGPDLSMLGRHIRRSWYSRWLLNPIRIVPRMEMPAVQIPIEGVLNNDLPAQYAAMWHVLNEPGFQPPRPNPVRVLRRRNDPRTPQAAALVIDNVEVGSDSYVKPILIGLANRHNVLFDLTSHRLAAWWAGDTARQRLRGKYWYWEAGGEPFLAAADQRSETSLVVGDREIYPSINRDFPPEYTYLQQVEGGLEFEVRLPFVTDALTADPVYVAQSLTAIPAASTHGASSGFRRRVRFSQLPKQSRIRFRAAPAATLEMDRNRRVVRPPQDDYQVVIHSAGIEFAESRYGLIELACDAEGTAELVLDYLTGLPVDQFLRRLPLPPPAEPDRLHTLPGFITHRLPLPETITPTALAWDHADRLLVATLKGQLFRITDTNGDGLEDQPTLIADGFSAPFGLARHTDDQGRRAIDIADKTALCRLFDTTGDGSIDRIETAASGWGNNTDYHGWIVGLPQDEQGNYYAVVSNRNGPLSHFRGAVMKLHKRAPTADDPRSYRVEKLAVGLRFPVGIARNRAGELFVTDNQGQYNPFNELNYVVKGAHYGFFNLAGLEDTPELKRMPKRGPAVGIPHPWVRSVNGICFLETPPRVRRELGRDLYGPFEGQMIGCEATTRGLVRVSLQRVGDQMQGAAYPMTVPPERDSGQLLRPLVCQLAPNGDIYVGSVHDSAWGAGRNIGELAQLRFTGKLPTGIAEMRLIDGQFVLDMTHPVDRDRALDRANYALTSYRRIPSSGYGAPDSDYRRERLAAIELSEEASRITLSLEQPLRRGFVYELKLQNLTLDGRLFHPAEAHYTNGPL